MVLAPDRAVCTLVGLWHGFGWTLARDVLERICLQENAGVGCASLLWEQNCCHPEKLLLRPGWQGGVDSQESTGVECTISKLGGECSL